MNERIASAIIKEHIASHLQVDEGFEIQIEQFLQKQMLGLRN